MELFRTWEWTSPEEDFQASTSFDGVFWNADMAYYPGKTSRPTVKQTFQEFLSNGPPDGYEGCPEAQLKELRETVQRLMQSG